MIVQADAQHIPLVDGCVQACVTSPPYFGLRKYDIPESVWDGEAGCEHEWASETEEREIRTGLGLAELGKRYRDGGHKQGQIEQFTIQRGTCRHCSAWRGQLGLEPMPDLYVQHIVQCFREVRQVLRDDGVCWVVIGDSYATGAGKVGECPGGGEQGERWKRRGEMTSPNRMPLPGLKPKDLVGIPWRVAFALQADGWWLRSDVIWSKPNPMPESVTDRPTRAHEYVFMLTKRARYFTDMDAVREAALQPYGIPVLTGQVKRAQLQSLSTSTLGTNQGSSGRNLRTVWHLSTQPYAGAHFATFPESLVARCIRMSTSHKACEVCGAPWGRVVETSYENPGNRTTNGPRSTENRAFSPGFAQRLEKRTTTTGFSPTCSHPNQGTARCLVLDPFGGSGTVARVAESLGRDWVSLDLGYHDLARERVRVTRGLPMEVAAC